MSIRILLADDHRILREGLRSLLAQQPDVLVVGEASDGDSVIALARELRPDLVIMDVVMPGTDGIAAPIVIPALHNRGNSSSLRSANRRHVAPCSF